MSPSLAIDKPSSVIFMFGDVDIPEMLIVDLNLARVVQHSPFQFHALAYAVQAISCSVPKLLLRSCAVCIAHDDHYLMLFTLSSLK